MDETGTRSADTDTMHTVDMLGNFSIASLDISLSAKLSLATKVLKLDVFKYLVDTGE